MLTYLEGTRYKLQSTLLELDHKQRGTHPLAGHIQVTRDRHGLQQSILKVPLWLKSGNEGDTPTTTTPGNDDEYVNRFIEPMDVRNEAVIGSYSRSTSHLEMTGPCQFTAQSLGDGGDDEAASPVALQKTGSGEKTIDDGDRGIADGGSNQHDSDFGELLELSPLIGDCLIVAHLPDEFSSHDEAEEEDEGDKSGVAPEKPREVIGRCRAMYNYTPKLYDELELEPGDIIEIHTKEDNGWWLGALKNRIGIFPATYVEELH